MTMAPNTHGERYVFLDGLRGLAISLVFLYHAYARWPEVYPYGDSFSSDPVLAYGWLGVYLFFIISGFVIFMTLERCTSFREFILKRWLRLFPAMLICSLLVFMTAPWFPERPAGTPEWRDLLPGLTLIDPMWWAKVLGSPQGELEGAFWSIFVEVKFYFIFGSLYFLLGGKRAVYILIAIFLFWAVGHSDGQIQGGRVDALANMFNALTGAQYYAWFAAGALFYKGAVKQDRRYWAAAVLMCAMGANYLQREDVIGEEFAILLPVVFLMPLLSMNAARFAEHRSLVFIGFVSYPYYLMHENMTVAMIAKGHDWFPWLPGFLLPALPLLIVVALAWLIVTWAEPALRRWLALPLKRYLAVRRQLPE